MLRSECAGCAQYDPKTDGCLRAGHGLKCVLELPPPGGSPKTIADMVTGEPDYGKTQRSALNTQVGGGHYKDFPIQPAEFSTKNKLGFLEGCVIKRMCRWRTKNGIEDLKKAIHEIELLIELEEKSNG